MKIRTATILISGIILLLFSYIFFSDHSEQSALEIDLPIDPANGEIIRHQAYTLKYIEQYEQPSWVQYTLTRERINGTVSRTDDFRADPTVVTGTATLGDYKGSGYDRGHLAPAGDMKWSQAVMSESFFMSNMSPQVPGFNRGIWNKLEASVRTWAQENAVIHIVVGPVNQKDHLSIGENSVAVPSYFYKVVLDIELPEYKGIGFILPNAPSNTPLQSFAVTIDSVEKFTAIDFFPGLPDDIENRLESATDTGQWSFSAFQSVAQSKTVREAVHCLGITKNGQRCMRKTTNENGYCWQHQSQAGASE